MIMFCGEFRVNVVPQISRKWGLSICNRRHQGLAGPMIQTKHSMSSIYKLSLYPWQYLQFGHIKEMACD